MSADQPQTEELVDLLYDDELDPEEAARLIEELDPQERAELESFEQLLERIRAAMPRQEVSDDLHASIVANAERARDGELEEADAEVSDELHDSIVGAAASAARDGENAEDGEKGEDRPSESTRPRRGSPERGGESSGTWQHLRGQSAARVAAAATVVLSLGFAIYYLSGQGRRSAQVASQGEKFEKANSSVSESVEFGDDPTSEPTTSEESTLAEHEAPADESAGAPSGEAQADDSDGAGDSDSDDKLAQLDMLDTPDDESPSGAPSPPSSGGSKAGESGGTPPESSSGGSGRAKAKQKAPSPSKAPADESSGKTAGETSASAPSKRGGAEPSKEAPPSKSPSAGERKKRARLADPSKEAASSEQPSADKSKQPTAGAPAEDSAGPSTSSDSASEDESGAALQAFQAEEESSASTNEGEGSEGGGDNAALGKLVQDGVRGGSDDEAGGDAAAPKKRAKGGDAGDDRVKQRRQKGEASEERGTAGAKARKESLSESGAGQKKAPSKDEASPEVGLDELETAYKRGKYTEVVEQAETLAASDAADLATKARALQWKGKALEKQGAWRRARDVYQTLQREYPSYRSEAIEQAQKRVLRELRDGTTSSESMEMKIDE